MDPERFRRAAETVLGGAAPDGGIGTLGEKTLHAVLKRYLEPDERRHEVACGRFVADILTNAGVVEIQTGGFDKLRPRLHYYLGQRGLPVTVVYPVAGRKWLSWVDPATGETLSRRRSPKAGCVQDVFPELYRLRPMLPNPLLQVRILLLELEEVRLLDGWSRDRKRGSHRLNRYPRALLDEQTVGGPAGFSALVPEKLRDAPPFSSAELARLCRISPRSARLGLSVLTQTGDVRRVGKRGNAFLYQTAAK